MTGTYEKKMSESVFEMRLRNEYDDLVKRTKNARYKLFDVVPAPGQKIPYVTTYHVTYHVPTWVMENDRLIRQNETVVEVRKCDLDSALHAKVIRGRIPYHPNWYPTTGSICNGDAADNGSIAIYDYLCFVCGVLQFKEIWINPNSPANIPARDYWLKHRNDSSLFPTCMEDPQEMTRKPLFSIRRVTRG